MAENDRHRALLACCRPDADPQGDRHLKTALQHMDADPGLRSAFASQAGFDREVGAQVRAIPLPADFAAEVRAGMNRSAAPPAAAWRAWLRQPALWAVLLSGAFLAAWAGQMLYDRATGFPGDDTVRELVERALNGADGGRGRIVPLVTETGKLGDTLFLEHNLDQYEVPAAFAHEQTVGYRVFERNDNPVTQVQVRTPDMTFLVFRADAQGIDITPADTWKHLAGEDWDASVEVHNALCFVIVCREGRAPLDAYLKKGR